MSKDKIWYYCCSLNRIDQVCFWSIRKIDSCHQEHTWQYVIPPNNNILPFWPPLFPIRTTEASRRAAGHPLRLFRTEYSQEYSAPSEPKKPNDKLTQETLPPSKKALKSSLDRIGALEKMSVASPPKSKTTLRPANEKSKREWPWRLPGIEQV